MIPARTRRRLTLAGLMAMIAVVAVGLWAYRQYYVAPREAMIRRAKALIARTMPEVDIRGFEGRLGSVSADGRFQEVILADPEGRRPPATATFPVPRAGVRPNPAKGSPAAPTMPGMPPPSPPAPAGSPATKTP